MVLMAGGVCKGFFVFVIEEISWVGCHGHNSEIEVKIFGNFTFNLVMALL